MEMCTKCQLPLGSTIILPLSMRKSGVYSAAEIAGTVHNQRDSAGIRSAGVFRIQHPWWITLAYGVCAAEQEKRAYSSYNETIK